MNGIATVLVVGSGAAGAQAASQAIHEGCSVIMLDYGIDDTQTASIIPDASFSEIRSSDSAQRSYFVGQDDLSEMDEIRAGAHLTPPRQFIVKDVDRLLPFHSDTFQAMQSLALGGLAAGWGAGAYTFEESELREAGLPANEIRAYYESVANDIGISGALSDDNAPFALEITDAQTPLEVDTNASSILATYAKHRDRLIGAGFFLGRAPVAALSTPGRIADETRHANPYFDMDFYSDSRRSVYRPKYTIEKLKTHPNFRYVGGALVERFQEDEEGVTVFYRNNGTSEILATRGSALLLAANAVNTARLALTSFNLTGTRVPLLSNPYHYLACVNLQMFGRPAQNRRHSLAQLFGVYTPQHREWERVTAAFYSYRSLLLYKLVKEMPLPLPLGLLAARVLLTSFTIVGVHHPDRPTQHKWLELSPDGTLQADYELERREKELIHFDLAGIKRALWTLRCIPLMTIDPGYGSSIHYAGTLPSGPGKFALGTDHRGKINGTRAVFAADSAGWRYLPAKGLTFTIMANARRVASEACKDLRRSVPTA